MALSMSIFSSISSYSGLLQNEQESQGIPRSAFFSDAQVKERRVLFQTGECVEEEMSTLSFEHSDRKIFFLSVNFC